MSHQVYDVYFGTESKQDHLGAIALFGQFPRSLGMELIRVGLMQHSRSYFYVEEYPDGWMRVPVRGALELFLRPVEGQPQNFLDDGVWPVPVLPVEPHWRLQLRVCLWVYRVHGFQSLIRHIREHHGRAAGQ